MAILVHSEFGILRLTISRPEKRNALSAEMFNELTDALADAARDDAVRTVLIKGDDRLFSAGADLEEMQRAPEELERAMTAFFAELRRKAYHAVDLLGIVEDVGKRTVIAEA